MAIGGDAGIANHRNRAGIHIQLRRRRRDDLVCNAGIGGTTVLLIEDIGELLRFTAVIVVSIVFKLMIGIGAAPF